MSSFKNFKKGSIIFALFCLSIIFHFFDSPKYESTARLYVKQDNKSNSGLDISSIGSSLGINLEESFSIESNPNIYPTILNSRKFFDDVLNIEIADRSFSDYLKNNFLNDKDIRDEKIANEKMLKIYREEILNTYVERKNLVVVVSTALNTPENSQQLNREILDLLDLHLSEIKLKDIRDKLIFLNQSLDSKIADLDIVDNQISDFKYNNVNISSPSLELELEKLLRKQRSIDYSRLNLQNQIEMLKIEEFNSKMPIQILDNPSYPLKRLNTLFDKLKLVFLLGLSIELLLYYRKDILKIVGYLDWKIIN